MIEFWEGYALPGILIVAGILAWLLAQVFV